MFKDLSNITRSLAIIGTYLSGTGCGLLIGASFYIAATGALVEDWILPFVMALICAGVLLLLLSFVLFVFRVLSWLAKGILRFAQRAAKPRAKATR